MRPRVSWRFSIKQKNGCDQCGAPPFRSTVKYTTHFNDGPTHRQRECHVCGHVYSTFESLSPQQFRDETDDRGK